MQIVEHPRTTREYETIVIIRTDIGEEERNRVFSRIEGVFERLGGTLLRRDDWGKRRLAYPINKLNQGSFHYFLYLGYNDLIAELERNLRLLEPVLKYMTVKLDEDVNRELRLAEYKANEAAEREAAQRRFNSSTHDQDIDHDDEDDDEEE